MSPLHKIKTRAGRTAATKYIDEDGDEPTIMTPGQARERIDELIAIANGAADRFEEATSAAAIAKALVDMADADEEQGQLVQLAFGATSVEVERAQGYRQSGVLLRLVAIAFVAQVVDRNRLADELDKAPWLTVAENTLVPAVWPALTAVANAGADIAAQAAAMQEFAKAAHPHVGSIAAETAHWMTERIAAKAAKAGKQVEQ